MSIQREKWGLRLRSNILFLVLLALSWTTSSIRCVLIIIKYFQHTHHFSSIISFIRSRVKFEFEFNENHFAPILLFLPFICIKNEISCIRSTKSAILARKKTSIVVTADEFTGSVFIDCRRVCHLGVRDAGSERIDKETREDVPFPPSFSSRRGVHALVKPIFRILISSPTRKDRESDLRKDPLDEEKSIKAGEFSSTSAVSLLFARNSRRQLLVSANVTFMKGDRRRARSSSLRKSHADASPDPEQMFKENLACARAHVSAKWSRAGENRAL